MRIHSRFDKKRFVRPTDVKIVVEGPAYSHLDVSELQDAILHLERETRDRIEKNGPRALSTKLTRCQSPIPDKRLDCDPDADSKAQPSSDTVAGRGGAKSPSLKIVVRDEMGLLKPQSVRALIKTIFQVRLNFATKIVKDEFTLDSRALLRMIERATRPPLQISSYEDHLRNLPMANNKLNIELVRLYLQLLCRFKAAVDGAPDPANRFMRHWVPLSIKSPLNLQIILYTSACFLSETGQVPKAVAWVHQSAVHKLFNDYFAKAGKNVGDEVILGTAQMVLDSWYWGSTQEIKVYMHGLKDLIRNRGGMQVLGMQGFLAKTVITDDITIALAHEVPTSMFDQTGFEFVDDFMVPYQVSFNSPFMSDWPPFSSPASALDLHPHANQILDDVRTLLKFVLDLPLEKEGDEAQQVQQQAAELATWTYQRILILPEDVLQRDGKYRQHQEELKKQQQRTHQHLQRPSQSWSALANDELAADTWAAGTASSQWEASATNHSNSSSLYSDCAPTQQDLVMTSSTLAGSGSGSGSHGEQQQQQQQQQQKQEEDEERQQQQQTTTPQRPDLMYRVIRSVALIYCRAIMARIPTSHACTPDEFEQVWASAWAVPLAQWKTVLGVYHWATVGLVPSGHDTPPARFSKMLMAVTLLSMGLDNWHICMEVSRAALRLQRWLRGGVAVTAEGAGRGIIGGEAGVDKYGFFSKGDLPAVMASESWRGI